MRRLFFWWLRMDHQTEFATQKFRNKELLLDIYLFNELYERIITNAKCLH